MGFVVNEDYPHWGPKVTQNICIGMLLSAVLELVGIKGAWALFYIAVLGTCAALLGLTLIFGILYYIAAVIFAPSDATADWGEEWIPFWLK